MIDLLSNTNYFFHLWNRSYNFFKFSSIVNHHLKIIIIRLNVEPKFVCITKIGKIVTSVKETDHQEHTVDRRQI